METLNEKISSIIKKRPSKSLFDNEVKEVTSKMITADNKDEMLKILYNYVKKIKDK